jgi:tetratricopeptide (TPR) repeat protein
MIWRAFHFFGSMASVVITAVKDLVWEELSWDEIRANYLFGKANAFDRAHFWKKAVGVYEEILKGDPNSIPVLLNLGGLYYRKGMYEEAIAQYEKVIKVNRKHYLGHYWLAMCCWKLTRYYAAINTLEEVIEMLPTFKDALNLMGRSERQPKPNITTSRPSVRTPKALSFTGALWIA